MMYSISISCIILFVTMINHCFPTALDDYVNTPDPLFSWQRIATYPQGTYTVYLLNMTSQRWMDDALSSQSIWWHYIAITVPIVIRRQNTAFLLITGSDNIDPEPTTNPMTTMAIKTGSITATLWQIPNQPFRFWADPLNKSRDEDSLIAWTWKQFLDTNGSDPRILLRFPMTKASVRAMDAIQQFLQQQHLSVPTNFVIGGASKRGWTTWTTAAVDNQRVIGAVPIVMDLLNIRPNMMSHYRSLGGWTFVFNDYYEMNITRYMDSPYLDKLSELVDPYYYFDRYSNMKIFQLQGAGDEFFLVDSEDFFWDKLQIATGGSYLRRIPNTGHNIQGYDESLTSFYLSVADKTALPLMTWTRTINGTHGIIHAVVDFSNSKPKPLTVTAYQVRTSDTLKRDFRQAKLDKTTGTPVANPIVWTNTAVQFHGENNFKVSYSLTVPIPTDGYWVAAFLQATFAGREGTTLTLTTETIVLPNTYPVDECHDQECYGKLV